MVSTANYFYCTEMRGISSLLSLFFQGLSIIFELCSEKGERKEFGWLKCRVLILQENAKGKSSAFFSRVGEKRPISQEKVRAFFNKWSRKHFNFHFAFLGWIKYIIHGKIVRQG